MCIFSRVYVNRVFELLCFGRKLRRSRYNKGFLAYSLRLSEISVSTSRTSQIPSENQSRQGLWGLRVMGNGLTVHGIIYFPLAKRPVHTTRGWSAQPYLSHMLSAADHQFCPSLVAVLSVIPGWALYGCRWMGWCLWNGIWVSLISIFILCLQVQFTCSHRVFWAVFSWIITLHIISHRIRCTHTQGNKKTRKQLLFRLTQSTLLPCLSSPGISRLKTPTRPFSAPVACFPSTGVARFKTSAGLLATLGCDFPLWWRLVFSVWSGLYCMVPGRELNYLLRFIHVSETASVARLATFTGYVFDLLVRAVGEVAGVRVGSHDCSGCGSNNGIC